MNVLLIEDDDGFRATLALALRRQHSRDALIAPSNAHPAKRRFEQMMGMCDGHGDLQNFPNNTARSRTERNRGFGQQVPAKNKQVLDTTTPDSCHAVARKAMVL